MKKTLPIAILIFLSISAFGQKIRFTDSTNVWNEIGMSGWPIYYWNYTCYFSGHIIRGGMSYQVLFGSAWAPSGSCYIREDTTLGKVYVILQPNYGGSSVDTTEQVLYDYNWQVGDTVIRNVTDHYEHVISGIDSTLINATWHKVWHFHQISITVPTKDFDVIEGIGCTDDPIFPLFPLNFEAGTQLFCFNTNSTTPTVSPKVSGYFDNTTSCTLGVDQITPKSKTTTIYPNPIDETSKIVFSNNISTGSVTVVNDIGQVVLNIPFQNKDDLLIGDKINVPGIYFYRVTDNNNGQVLSGKFVK